VTSALGLATYAVLAATLGASLLRRASWTSAMPRLGIAAWQSLTFSVLFAAVLAGAGLTIGLAHHSLDLAAIVHLCASNLRHRDETPAGGATALAGAALSTLILQRLGWCVARRFVSEAVQRRRTWDVLRLIGDRSAVPGALLVEHDAPYAFCLAGRRNRVVVTRGLVRSLDASELDAVLAHEHGHLKSRHHAAILIATALADAFAWALPLFRTAREQIASLVEMCADDTARRQVGDAPLRSALARLAPLNAPVTALAASGQDVQHRLDRLDSGVIHPHLATKLMLATAVAAAALAPVAIAVGPAITTAWEALCHVG
jgi:Zn-dependent protease with chaperone function